MSKTKTAKEVAFLYDLYVASDWGERFAELLDEHTKLPEQGRILYVASGTGGHALEWYQKAGTDVSLVGVEENAELWKLAQAKAGTVKAALTFLHHAPDSLPLPDNHFDLAVCEASLVDWHRVPKVLAELARVTKVGGTVALTLVTTGSFGEFVSIYWEALFHAEIAGHEHDAEDLLMAQPTPDDVTQWAKTAGLGHIALHSKKEEFAYESGAAFVEAPLIADFLLKNWLAALPDKATRTRLTKSVAHLVDEDRDTTPFAFSVKATLLTGKRK